MAGAVTTTPPSKSVRSRLPQPAKQLCSLLLSVVAAAGLASEVCAQHAYQQQNAVARAFNESAVSGDFRRHTFGGDEFADRWVRPVIVEIEEEQAADGEPQGTQSASASEAAPLGQEPDDISKIFLRQSSSLLAPGRVQYEVGFVYLWQDASALTILPGGVLDFQEVRDRRFLVPLTIRYGLNDCVELFGSLPVGVSHFERTDPMFRDATTRGGLGDAGAGLLVQWLRETDDNPDVISSISVTAPTGPDPFKLSPNVAALGSGFWSMNTSVSLVKSFDPIVLFGGVGYRHEFGTLVQGIPVQPGEAFTYSFGMGFSVNDDIALNAEISGSFQGRLRANETLVPNSASELLALQLGYTRRLSSKRSIQPFVAMGLTDDSPDFLLGFQLICDGGKKGERWARCDP